MFEAFNDIAFAEPVFETEKSKNKITFPHELSPAMQSFFRWLCIASNKATFSENSDYLMCLFLIRFNICSIPEMSEVLRVYTPAQLHLPLRSLEKDGYIQRYCVGVKVKYWLPKNKLKQLDFLMDKEVFQFVERLYTHFRNAEQQLSIRTIGAYLCVLKHGFLDRHGINAYVHKTAHPNQAYKYDQLKKMHIFSQVANREKANKAPMHHLTPFGYTFIRKGCLA